MAACLAQGSRIVPGKPAKMGAHAPHLAPMAPPRQPHLADVARAHRAGGAVAGRVALGLAPRQRVEPAGR